MRMLKLFIIAAAAFMVSYTVVNTLIIPIAIGQFLLIEILISLSHAYYNYAKKKLNLVNPV
jgi:hypothetical protein